MLLEPFLLFAWTALTPPGLLSQKFPILILALGASHFNQKVTACVPPLQPVIRVTSFTAFLGCWFGTLVHGGFLM